MFERMLNVGSAQKILAEVVGESSIRVVQGEAGKGHQYDRNTATLTIDPAAKRSSGKLGITGALVKDISPELEAMLLEAVRERTADKLLIPMAERLARETWKLPQLTDSDKAALCQGVIIGVKLGQQQAQQTLIEAVSAITDGVFPPRQRPR